MPTVDLDSMKKHCSIGIIQEENSGIHLYGENPATLLIFAVYFSFSFLVTNKINIVSSDI